MSADLKEANELMWAELLKKGLRHFNKNQSDIDSDLKSLIGKQPSQPCSRSKQVTPIRGSAVN